MSEKAAEELMTREEEVVQLKLAANADLRREFLAERERAIRSSHEPADLDTIMRPYNYTEGKRKVMIVSVQADEQTIGGILIPGAAKVKTGEAVVVDIGDNPPADLGLSIGQRVQVAKYMGSSVDLREKWQDAEGNEQIVTREYITIDASYILNVFEDFSDIG